MLMSEEKLEIRNTILGLERRIEETHTAIQKYCQGNTRIMPDWQKLERDLISFSGRTIMDAELSQQLDRVLHKFQNRKGIWLRWVEDVYQRSNK